MVTGFDLEVALEAKHPGAAVHVVEHDHESVFYGLEGERGLRRRRWRETADGEVRVGSAVRLRPRKEKVTMATYRVSKLAVARKSTPAELADRLYAAMEKIRRIDPEVGDYLHGAMARDAFGRDAMPSRQLSVSGGRAARDDFAPVPLPRYPAGGHSYAAADDLSIDYDELVYEWRRGAAPNVVGGSLDIAADDYAPIKPSRWGQ